MLSTPITLYTTNINGIKNNGHHIAQHIIPHNTITAIQELRLHNSSHSATFQHHIDRHLGQNQYFIAINDHRQHLTSPSHTTSGGVAVVIQPSFPGYTDLQHLPEFDIPDRYMVTSTFWGNQPVYIHVVYAPAKAYGTNPQPPTSHDPFADDSDDNPTNHPNPHRNTNLKVSFFNRLPRDFPNDAIHIVLGDFNLAIDPTLDSSTPRADQHAPRTACLQWLSCLNVVDPWRLHNPTTQQFTGPIQGTNRRHRLDYIFINTQLNSTCYQSSKFHNMKSLTDHLNHSVTLTSHKVTMGHGYWKCPKELLEDPKIVTSIITEAQKILDKMPTSPNPGVLLDGFMRRTRRVLQHIHHVQLTIKNKTLRKATQRVNHAYRTRNDNYHSHQKFTHEKHLYTATQEAWKQYHGDLQFDAHRFHQEKSTKQFFRPPRTQLYKVPIGEALCPAYGPTTDPIEVQRIFVDHWEGVFRHDEPSRPTPHQREHLLQFLTSKISNTQRDLLESPLEIEELTASIKAMTPNKAPGLDGFPAKFFQLAPRTFAHILLYVFNDQLARGDMLGRHRQAAVALLYKNGDRRDPANYRPIALMSVELKILAKTLAFRMSHVMENIIHDIQKAFVPGRRLHDHIHLLTSLQTHISNSDNIAYATFLDFSKAYDRVDWDFMFGCLTKANFGPIFISWIKLLYHNPMVIIMHNGHQSRPVYPTRGVKQGCPLSALLFVLTIEPLSNLLRTHPELGIQIPSFEAFVAALFADDVLLFSQNYTSLLQQLNLVQLYCDGSGARLNRSKCKTLFLNNSKPIPTHPDLVMLPTNTPTKYLGLLFGHCLSDTTQLQLLDQRLHRAILVWGFRGRTLMGRVLLVKSVVLSILWHFSMVLHIPPNLVRRWQSMIRKYILCRRLKPDDPQYTLLSAAYQFDPHIGLGIPHIQSCLRYQRLRLLQILLHHYQDPTQPWARLVWQQLSSSLGDFYRQDSHDWLFFDKTQSTTIIDTSHVPTYWIDVWIHWSRLPWSHRIPNTPTQPITLGQALGMPIWLNAYPWFLCQGPRRPNPLAVYLQSYRPWYSLVAAHGFYCLADFMPQHTWPPLETFSSLIDQRLGPLPPSIKRPASLLNLYTQLTNFVDRIEDLLEISLRTPRLAIPLSPILFSYQHPDSPTTTLFTQLPKYHIKPLATHYPSPQRPHPMTSNLRPTTIAITKAMKQFKKWYKYLPPTYGNVWYQILLRTLPTNARFPWSQHTNPSTIECTYPSCHQPETYRHVLFECRYVAPTWSYHRQVWSQFGVNFTWDTILHPELFDVYPPFKHHKSRLRRLWFCLVGALLHTFWHTRLAHRYDNQPPPHTPYTIPGILDLWGTIIRSWLRQTPPLHRHSILDTISLLQHHPLYSPYWTTRPRLLCLSV